MLCAQGETINYSQLEIMMDQQQFIAELGKLRKSSTFLTLKAYRSDSGEVADYPD